MEYLEKLEKKRKNLHFQASDHQVIRLYIPMQHALLMNVANGLKRVAGRRRERSEGRLRSGLAENKGER